MENLNFEDIGSMNFKLQTLTSWDLKIFKNKLNVSTKRKS